MYLEKLASGKDVIGESDAPLEPPKDFDMEKFNRGRKFLRDHVLSCTFGMFIALVTGLSVNVMLEPLMFTEQSDTPKRALNRYRSTFLHVTSWFYGNIWDKNSKAYKSIMKVRTGHNRVRKNMMEHDRKEIVHAENESKIMRLSQWDMGLTQCGFLGMTTMYPKLLGIQCSEDELDDFVYFWYGIGYALGVTDQYTICRDYHTTKGICKEIETDVLIPKLRDPPKQFRKMAEALVDGVNSVFLPFYSVESLLAFAFEDQLGITKMSFLDYCKYLHMHFFANLLYYCPLFEKFFNVLLKFLYWDSGLIC